MGKSRAYLGGGVNYLCLPLDPEPPNSTQETNRNYYHTSIYGVEYETGKYFAHVKDHNPPCAVCEVQGRSAVLMIPAKQTCPVGWTKEYDGQLASERSFEESSRGSYNMFAEFVCVSKGMESRMAGNIDQVAGSLYVVKVVCGSLPCRPYAQGNEMSCVVCTK